MFIIFFKIKQFRDLSQIRSNRKNLSIRMAAERKITNAVMVLIFGFIVSRLPCSVVTMYTAFVDENGVVPIMATLPAVFANTLFRFLHKKRSRNAFSRRKKD